MLHGYKALDLTDEKGFACGKFLADLGVDVIKIEMPGGDPARHSRPSFVSKAKVEVSPVWLAYNAGKRGVTLDVTSAQGQEVFKTLAANVDFIIESFEPGYLDSLGLGYSALSLAKPELIMTSITPFGQTGPRKDWKVTDMISMAQGGVSWISGDPDRPPVRISAEIAFPLAGAYAAVGTLFALRHRQESGEGQHVDVAIHEAVVRCQVFDLGFWEWQKIITTRQGPMRRREGIIQHHTWKCKDGYICFVFLGGYLGARQVRRIVEWMDAEGAPAPALKARVDDWDNVDFNKICQEDIDSWEKEFGEFVAARTKEDLYSEAVKKGIFIAPVNTPQDIYDNNQLKETGFWRELPHSELGCSVTYPGPFCLSSEKSPEPRGRAPLPGEHNEQVYVRELGLSRSQVAALKMGGVV